jgi:hypothetical protein
VFDCKGIFFLPRCLCDLISRWIDHEL